MWVTALTIVYAVLRTNVLHYDLPKIKTSRGLNHAQTVFIVTRLILLESTRAQNLTILSSAIPEKFKGVKKFEMDRVTRATPILGMVGRPKAKA